ncbi:homoserine dehydrogenase [Sutterella sp.]|uniref:homoserine dehydrogenase n=1 Tax=Sutterella sp. TaxID=1981025 RepID=UPI0026E1052E|nr:homoserine dehydrogenase [Sutterella sp.]MDO5531493.1 homoserine dehydrogenase [Sutterella sp.]
MLKIGLLGFGTVGRSVAELLAERDCGIELCYILRRPGKAGGPLMTESFDEIINDPAVDVVVDVLSGIEPSHDYMVRALRAGKAVVTANKAALAAHYEELTAAAEAAGRPLLFEASCGGGIPWIENVKKAARVDMIEAMQGILNGTGNYILDRMDRFGMEFDAALAEAQAKGYAEADPTADIGGFDVANKAIISASVATGAPCTHPFPILGIERISKAILDDLREHGRAVRHMMIFRRTHHRYALGVVPVVIPAGSIEANVRDNYNCATLVGDVVGPLKFYGQGAGGHPTADAILQDLTSILTGKVESVAENKSLTYDAGILRGTGHFPDGSIPGRTLEELSAIARERGVFMAFEPED